MGLLKSCLKLPVGSSVQSSCVVGAERRHHPVPFQRVGMSGDLYLWSSSASCQLPDVAESENLLAFISLSLCPTAGFPVATVRSCELSKMEHGD